MTPMRFARSLRTMTSRRSFPENQTKRNASVMTKKPTKVAMSSSAASAASKTSDVSQPATTSSPETSSRRSASSATLSPTGCDLIEFPTLRLASLLWRLRRATAIESGLFKIQAKHLLQFRQRRQAHQQRQKIIDSMHRDAVATNDEMLKNADEAPGSLDTGSQPTAEPADQFDDLTRSFVRLSNLPTYPLDRLSRYEATLWRQACQILFTLRCLDQRKPWERLRLR